MLGYLVRRLLLALFTSWAISVLAFVIIQLPPGDYVDAYITNLSASGSGISVDQAQQLRLEYALDRPMYVQYWRWLRLIFQGDLGMAMEWQRPVTEVIGDRLWLTMVVSLAAVALTWVVALPIGIYSAVRPYSVADYFVTFLGFLGLAVPSFLLGLLVLYFGFRYFDTNIGGLFSAEYVSAPWSWGKLVDLLKHLPVPAVILGIAAMAQAIRIMRANLLDELRKPYVITARAKGLSEWRAILKYPVRVALNPIVSTIGWLLPVMFSGETITAVVLNLPTIGPVLLQSLLTEDMFLASGILLILTALTIVGTFISDPVLIWVDPRIRMERT